MNEIVKKCIKHGEITIDQVNQESMNNGLTFRLRCKLCSKDYQERTREARLAYSREYEKTKRVRPDDHYEKSVKPRSIEWRRKNKDLVNSRIAKDKELNREKYRTMQRNSRNKKIEKYRTRDILNKFKGQITFEDYKKMFDDQKGLCAICAKPEKKKSRVKGNVCRLAIDHNQKTGEIRKLLCHACNVAIGSFKEDINLIERAIEYIKKHKCE